MQFGNKASALRIRYSKISATNKINSTDPIFFSIISKHTPHILLLNDDPHTNLLQIFSHELSAHQQTNNNNVKLIWLLEKQETRLISININVLQSILSIITQLFHHIRISHSEKDVKSVHLVPVFDFSSQIIDVISVVVTNKAP